MEAACSHRNMPDVTAYRLRPQPPLRLKCHHRVSGINVALTSALARENTVNGQFGRDGIVILGRPELLSGSLGSEAIAGPGLGQDERGAVLRLELGPQPPHVNPQVLGLGLV